MNKRNIKMTMCLIVLSLVLSAAAFGAAVERIQKVGSQWQFSYFTGGDYTAIEHSSTWYTNAALTTGGMHVYGDYGTGFLKWFADWAGDRKFSALSRTLGNWLMLGSYEDQGIQAMDNGSGATVQLSPNVKYSALTHDGQYGGWAYYAARAAGGIDIILATDAWHVDPITNTDIQQTVYTAIAPFTDVYYKLLAVKANGDCELVINDGQNTLYDDFYVVALPELAGKGYIALVEDGMLPPEPLGPTDPRVFYGSLDAGGIDKITVTTSVDGETGAMQYAASVERVPGTDNKRYFGLSNEPGTADVIHALYSGHLINPEPPTEVPTPTNVSKIENTVGGWEKTYLTDGFYTAIEKSDKWYTDAALVYGGVEFYGDYPGSGFTKWSCPWSGTNEYIALSKQAGGFLCLTARADGGVDVLDNGSGNVVQHPSSVRYQALCHDGVQGSYMTFGARADGGIDAFVAASTWQEVSVPNITSLYKAIAPFTGVSLKLVAAKSDGGADLVMSSNGDWSGFGAAAIPALDGKQYIVLTEDNLTSGVFYGALASGGIDVITNSDSTWSVAPLTAADSTVYYSLTCDTLASVSTIEALSAKEVLVPVAVTQVKTYPDGAGTVACPGIVTAVFGNDFYIESEDRVGGIMVTKEGHGLSVGTSVTVFGKIMTLDTGERYIAASSIAAVGSGTVEPLAMTNKTLGGGDWFYNPGPPKSGQQGILDASGVNNIGLLVRTTGKVTGVGTGSFNIDDGSGVSVKALYSGATLPNMDDYVVVTGISSCEAFASELDRVIKVIDWRLP